MKTPLLNLMIIAIQKAANYVSRDFNEITFLLNTPNKAIDFAQQSHLKACKTIYNDLNKFKKSYSFIMPDSTKDIQKDLSNFFVINGILGLQNFSAGLSHFCLSLALERDSEIFAAVILNPITNELFYAEKNAGAFFNKQKLRYNTTDNYLSNLNGILATDIQGIKDVQDNPNKMPSLILGCPSLEICYLAANKFKGCNYKVPLKQNEIAPALLIAHEANLNLTYETHNNIITFLNNAE